MMNYVTLDIICNNDSVPLYCSYVIWFHDFRSDIVTRTIGGATVKSKGGLQREGVSENAL
jgi:hypothetical protein